METILIMGSLGKQNLFREKNSENRSTCLKVMSEHAIICIYIHIYRRITFPSLKSLNKMNKYDIHLWHLGIKNGHFEKKNGKRLLNYISTSLTNVRYRHFKFYQFN